ncbi:hypothetical protein CDO52_06170 [Nocardiopsis gilva YIM 90087]|uniref:Transposase IS4-like domain-containing protein n=2 Tax=Nocardiopsis gilva TaxID=280236 RepID=A0A223S2T0_9ACTN|nr:hypothetical protein CDO52_06170 [Nocardiopsis gilva YIM 90087]
MAVYGTTSRGARRADGTRVHLLGAAEHGGHLLDHIEVDIKHNETSHFTELLEPLDPDGAVVIFDAHHTVRGNLDWLAREKKAHDISVVKRNQPLLHARVRALPWRQVPAGSPARGPGTAAPRPTPSSAPASAGWTSPHARQAIKITRRRQDTATSSTSRETVYAVTTLTSAEATATDLARLTREHWPIEEHHHIRDVTLGEDNSTGRTGNGPVNLATIRAAITAAIKDAGYLHIPEGRRDHTTPTEALHLHGLGWDRNEHSRNAPEPCSGGAGEPPQDSQTTDVWAGRAPFPPETRTAHSFRLTTGAGPFPSRNMGQIQYWRVADIRQRFTLNF